MKTKVKNRKIKHRLSRKKYSKKKGGDPTEEDRQISTTVRIKPQPVQKNRNRALSEIIFGRSTSSVSPTSSVSSTDTPIIEPQVTLTRHNNRSSNRDKTFRRMLKMPSWLKRNAEIKTIEDTSSDNTSSDNTSSETNSTNNSVEIEAEEIRNPLRLNGGKRKNTKKIKNTKRFKKQKYKK